MKMALRRGMSHREYLANTSAMEVAEYMALDIIDPIFDGDRFEAAIGQLSSLTYNINRGENTEATSATDWMPNYAARLTAKTTEQLSDEFDKWYEQQGE
jgi:hypothetical protein